jgi:hypothetical protein
MFLKRDIFPRSYVAIRQQCNVALTQPNSKLASIDKGVTVNTIKLPPELPNLDKLIDIAIETGGETNRFDFKEVIDLRTDEHKIRLVRAIGSFGNTDEGGFVFIGIADDRTVTGLTDEVFSLFDQTPVQSIVNQYLSSPPVIQVRKHEREGKRLVIIEVQPFVEYPSIVKQSATYGSERLIAGSILFRNAAAESAVLTAEADLRRLCDVIVKRRASTFIEFVQRGTIGQIIPQKPNLFKELEAVRKLADKEWPSSEGTSPYIEVAFSSAEDLDLNPENLKSIIPNACIKIQHGFPFHHVIGSEVIQSTSWGWYGMIPFRILGESSEPPSYFWMLSRKGAFLDREDLWEDAHNSVIPGGIGLFHVMGRLILLIRFLDSFSHTINRDERTIFRISIACNNIKGRYLQDERGHFIPRYLPRAVEQRVEATLDISLKDLRRTMKDIALNLLDEIAWQFGRDDLSRQSLENFLSRAKDFFGREYMLSE